MTDDEIAERLEILWAAHEERQEADRITMRAMPAKGTWQPLLTSPPRPPFPWAQVIPPLITILTVVAAYLGINLQVATVHDTAKEAKTEATAAAAQSKENAVKIDAGRVEVQAHGRQLDRVMGNVADRVPGK